MNAFARFLDRHMARHEPKTEVAPESEAIERVAGRAASQAPPPPPAFLPDLVLNALMSRPARRP